MRAACIAATTMQAAAGRRAARVALSSAVLVPVPVSVVVNDPAGAVAGERLVNETVKLSSTSTTASELMATVKVWVSPALPVKLKVCVALT